MVTTGKVTDMQVQNSYKQYQQAAQALLNTTQIASLLAEFPVANMADADDHTNQQRAALGLASRADEAAILLQRVTPSLF